MPCPYQCMIFLKCLYPSHLSQSSYLCAEQTSRRVAKAVRIAPIQLSLPKLNISTWTMEWRGVLDGGGKGRGWGKAYNSCDSPSVKFSAKAKSQKNMMNPSFIKKKGDVFIYSKFCKKVEENRVRAIVRLVLFLPCSRKNMRIQNSNPEDG